VYKLFFLHLYICFLQHKLITNIVYNLDLFSYRNITARTEMCDHVSPATATAVFSVLNVSLNKINNKIT